MPGGSPQYTSEQEQEIQRKRGLLKLSNVRSLETLLENASPEIRETITTAIFYVVRAQGWGLLDFQIDEICKRYHPNYDRAAVGYDFYEHEEEFLKDIRSV